MKKLVGWPSAWILYLLGDLVSKPLCAFDCMAWLYPIYNSLMIASSDIQDWCDCTGPWTLNLKDYEEE